MNPFCSSEVIAVMNWSHTWVIVTSPWVDLVMASKIHIIARDVPGSNWYDEAGHLWAKANC